MKAARGHDDRGNTPLALQGKGDEEEVEVVVGSEFEKATALLKDRVGEKVTMPMAAGGEGKNIASEPYIISRMSCALGSQMLLYLLMIGKDEMGGDMGRYCEKEADAWLEYVKAFCSEDGGAKVSGRADCEMGASSKADSKPPLALHV